MALGLLGGAGHGHVLLILHALQTLADQPPQGLDDADVLDPRLLAAVGLVRALAAVARGAGAGGAGGVEDDLGTLLGGGRRRRGVLVGRAVEGVGVVWVGAALEHAS